MATPISNMTVTWNNAGTTFNAIKMNVTDTASNANSLLMDLQVGGANRALVSKSGIVAGETILFDATAGAVFPIGAAMQSAGILRFSRSNDGGAAYSPTVPVFDIAYDGTNYYVDLINTASSLRIGGDTRLFRDAANTLAQRNATNAQNFRIYGSYTDASNYERVAIGMAGATYDIIVQQAGTGIARQLRFGVNNTVQWAINNSGHFVSTGDNSYDIGASGSARPRYLYLGGGSLTGTAADSSVTISPTWNTTGTPTAILLNVTDTASNAASKLLDLGTGGGSFVSRFSVGKTGGLTFNLASPSGSDPQIRLSATQTIYTAGSTTWIGGGGVVGTLDSTFYIGGSSDVQLNRDAANTLAQRNATNAQTFNVYNTYTTTTNYERGFVSWLSNTFCVGTEKGSGGGTARSLQFRTDGVGRWFMDTNGHFTAVTDNTYDIGASGANRPRNVYIAGTADLGSGNLSLASDVRLSRRSSGVLLLDNNGGTDFGRLQFGGTTSAFPALKRVGANLQTVAADDTATAGLIVGNQALATTATDGFLYVPSCAGTPTGVPTARTGTVPIVVDTTNNKLYFYSGAAWRDAGP